MTRQQTTEQILKVVTDFNQRGIPIYLSKLCDIIPDPEYGKGVDAALPTISKYVTELLAEGRLKALWVDNVDSRGHNRELFIPEYFERDFSMQKQREITELRRIAFALEDFAKAIGLQYKERKENNPEPKDTRPTLDQFMEPEVKQVVEPKYKRW